MFVAARYCHAADAAFFEELSVDDYDAIFRVNFMGVIHALKATTPSMLKRS